jgi:hypothetical protein
MGLWLISPLICSAGWYKYQDENGVWHFTDSMTAEQPVEKRKVVEKVAEPDDYLTPAQRKEKRLRETQARAAEDEAAAEKQKQESIKHEYKDMGSYEALEKKRAELAELYKTMMDQKRKLEADKEKIDNRTAYEKHQKMVREFNKSADDYKSRRAVYEQAVKEYEAKQKQAQAQAQAKSQ